MSQWWERWPGRLEAEYTALDAAGISYVRDEAAFAKGVLRLELKVPLEGEPAPIPLVSTFPDNYPYFRFEVEAPSLALAHHQHPFGKNLCLIGRATANWRTRDTLAGVLLEQLRTVLETGASDDLAFVEGKEEIQAEPFEVYPLYPPSMIIVQSEWEIPKELDSGFLKIGLAPASPPPSDPFVRGIVLEVQDDQKHVVAATTTNYLAFSDQVVEGRWMRTRNKLVFKDQRDLEQNIKSMDRGGYSISQNARADGHLRIYGLLHPDEVVERRRVDEGWLFLCEYRMEASQPLPVTKPKNKKKGRNWGKR